MKKNKKRSFGRIKYAPLYLLGLCVGIISIGDVVMVNASGAKPSDLDFNWENGLSQKLDNYSSVYNNKNGKAYGGDTLVANANGGIPNAPLLGNGNVGAVFGGSAGGQSLNLGMNSFWQGTYNRDDMSGMTPQALGSVGYNLLEADNVANTDVDLATKHKRVKASTEMYGFPASAAVSGDYVSNAFWGMGWWSEEGQGQNSWLMLEYDEPITFSRFQIWNAGSCMYDAGYDHETGRENWTTNAFEIQVSNDANDWTTVYQERDNFQPIYDRDLEAPATGKYVRLFVNKPVIKGGATTRICKFSLFENKKNDKNIMPILVNGKQSDIKASSTCEPSPGEDAHHIYTVSNLYATVSGVQQHLAGYGSTGYGWFTDTDPDGDYITYKFNRPGSFKSYQVYNGSASAAGFYDRGDIRGWKLETSVDGSRWNEVHRVEKPTDPSDSAWAGQPGISSFNIDEGKLQYTKNVRYVRFTVSSAFNGRALLAQLKLLSDTLENCGIDSSRDATFYQNIKEGKVGAKCTYNNKSYEAFTTISQDGTSYLATEIKNTSNDVLKFRYYTQAHLYKSPKYCQSAGVSEDGRTIYSTRTTPLSTPTSTDLIYVSAATMAAQIENSKWDSTGYTNGYAYGDFTIPVGASVKIITNVDGRQYNELTPGYDSIRANNSPTIKNAISNLNAWTSKRDLFAETANWWKDYWNSSFVDIYDNVVEMYYYTAMYIVGSATRANNAPASLFGPFITSDSTSWGGTYVTDYNLYGTYMAVSGANRADLLRPLVENTFMAWGGIDGLGDGIGKEYADRINSVTYNKFKNKDGSLMFKNGVDGVMSAVASAPHGYAIGVNTFDNIIFTSAYQAIPVLRYFDMTQGTGVVVDDILLTRELEYEYLKDIMMLWEQILVFENGAYRVKHDGAWEYESNDMGNAFTIACMHMFTNRLIDDAKALGITEDDEPRILKWKHIDKFMEPYPTAMVKDNDVERLCFSDTLTTALKGHVTYNGRTDGNSNPNVVVAQVLPTDQLGLYSDPEAKQIMRNSIQTIKSWGNINAMPTFFSAAARVGFSSTKYGNNNSKDFFDKDCQTLMEQYHKVVAGGMKQNSISKLCDPLLLIDTCGGAQGLNDMLFQDDKGIITFFPAYSNDEAGRFVNLQAKGGFLVSGAQDNKGHVSFAKITSKFGGKTTVAMPQNQMWEVIDQDGNKVLSSLSTVGAITGFDCYNTINTISFETKAGCSYYMVEVTKVTNALDNLVMYNKKGGYYED